MSGITLLVAAYALIWVAVAAYVTWMVRRQERLRREVEALRGAVEARGQPRPKTS